ncbi:MAG TPA: FAD-binding oxidoreductase [Candidatus Thioglobus sp.]|nr:FAD-binding oxidoreductase [Candidatus Thioglobus sp.]HIL20107.1 FAD-binding oxidoreductase [Candidatus Thioglobus sp.]
MAQQNKHYAGNCDHTGSYYASSANNKSFRKQLVGDHEVEICVVGGGYSGLSAALHLAEKGHQVSLIEGARIGWGASGRNGGQIVNGLNASLGVIEKRYGNEFASFVGKLVQEGGQIIRGNISKYNIQCDLKEGNLFAAYTQKHLRELEAKQKLWRSHGMDDHEMVSKSDMHQFVGSDVYSGGMIDKTGGHIHPLNLALGEATAIESNGGRIFEMTRMQSMKTQGQDIVVTTDKGTICCKKLVICGNAYLGKVIPKLTSRVMPVSTQILATKPLSDDLANELLPMDMCVEDVRYILDYYRLSADKRLLFGGGTVYGGSDPKDIVAKLRPNMEKVFPQLKGIQVDHAWSGNFALSFSRVPQMGRLDNNVYFAHGYSGHGVTGSHLFGRILSEAIDGDTKRFDEFAKVPWIPFPGGRSLRVPYSVAGSWWYGLRDTLGL